MKLSFSSSKTREIQRLLNIYSEYQWFFDNDFPIVLPKFYKKLYQESKNRKEFGTKLEKEFNKIYKKGDYNGKIEAAKDNWEKINNEFFDILKNHGQRIKDKYLCYVSLCGPEGQFKYPNIVDLRLNSKSDIKQVNETIAHELIHLIILRKAEKLNLSYKQTEGVVDLFFKETSLKDLFPDYKLQSIAEHNDGIFKKVIS